MVLDVLEVRVLGQVTDAVDLAAEAVLDGRVEEGGHEGSADGRIAEPERAGEQPDEADGREQQPDALGEARWARVLEVRRRSEPRPDVVPEEVRRRRPLHAEHDG